MMEKVKKVRKELVYDGVNVVFDNPLSNIDMKRAFLINCILLYASFSDRTVRIVFFNGEKREKGVSFFFCRDDPGGYNEPNKLHN
jgi:hypothetical protein